MSIVTYLPSNLSAIVSSASRMCFNSDRYSSDSLIFVSSVSVALEHWLLIWQVLGWFQADPRPRRQQNIRSTEDIVSSLHGNSECRTCDDNQSDMVCCNCVCSVHFIYTVFLEAI